MVEIQNLRENGENNQDVQMRIVESYLIGMIRQGLCRKSSKNYSRKHVFLISCCNEQGHGKCCFCQIPWENQ